MMSRTENGRHTKRMSLVSSTRSIRMTARNVYMLPMENQNSIGSDGIVLARIAGRRREAAEFALDQFGETDCRAVFQIWADDLHADRQSRFRSADRKRDSDAMPAHAA